MGIVEEYRKEIDVTLRMKQTFFNTNDTYPIDEQATFIDVARNAIINDYMLITSNLQIEVDAMGTVIIETRDTKRGEINATSQPKHILRIPQEKAYQRIVEAVQRNFELLERLYEEGHQGTLIWFRCSLFTAVLETIIITLSICIPYLLYSSQLEKQAIPVIIFVILTNIINAGVTVWIFRQTHLANKQVDHYLNSLQEIRTFSAITHTIKHIQMSDTQKSSLQKTLISSSLGIATLSEGPTKQPTGSFR